MCQSSLPWVNTFLFHTIRKYVGGVTNALPLLKVDQRSQPIGIEPKDSGKDFGGVNDGMNSDLSNNNWEEDATMENTETSVSNDADWQNIWKRSAVALILFNKAEVLFIRILSSNHSVLSNKP